MVYSVLISISYFIYYIFILSSLINLGIIIVDAVIDLVIGIS